MNRPAPETEIGIPAAAAGALAAGLLAWLADYPRPIALLAWVAPAPALYVALRRPPRDALWLGVLWGVPLLGVFAIATDATFLPLGAIAGLYAAGLLWKGVELWLSM